MYNTLKNSVHLIGNVGKEVEIINFETGNKKTSFSLATSDYYTNNQGEKVKQTEWHNLIAWGKSAEIMAKILRKGDEVAIQGKLTSRSYTDKNDVTRYVTEIVVNEFIKLSKNDKNNAVSTQEEHESVQEEILPF